VTTNLAVEVFALESVAEHTTAVRPIGNRLPDRGVTYSVAATDVVDGQVQDG
jgi:hypothetical protein